MSAQVTEAHRELARRIMFEFTQAGTATASDVRMAAQIIADSEARACAELRGALALGQQNCDDVFEDLRLERDQLRAECNNLRADLDAIKAIRDEETARAERAEAEVEEQCLLNGKGAEREASLLGQLERSAREIEQKRNLLTVAIKSAGDQATRAERAEADADSTRERALALANSLDEAQAELAAERKKVKTLHKALGDVKNSICRNVPDGYSQPCVDESADECDRIIDAAMKEGA